MEAIIKNEFIIVVKNNQGVINSLCKLYSKTHEEIKDNRQDVILALWCAFPNFREESKISTWIYKVALNTLISGKRKKMRRIITEPYTTDSENYPIQNMGSDDDYQLLQQAISLLKEIDKAVVILHLEGYGNKEISRILCLSETNISTRLNRIKKHLSLTFKSGQHEPRKF